MVKRTEPNLIDNKTLNGILTKELQVDKLRMSGAILDSSLIHHHRHPESNISGFCHRMRILTVVGSIHNSKVKNG